MPTDVQFIMLKLQMVAQLSRMHSYAAYYAWYNTVQAWIVI